MKIKNIKMKENILVLKGRRFKIISNLGAVKKLIRNFKNYCYTTSILTVTEKQNNLEFKVFSDKLKTNIINLNCNVIVL